MFGLGKIGLCFASSRIIRKGYLGDGLRRMAECLITRGAAIRSRYGARSGVGLLEKTSAIRGKSRTGLDGDGPAIVSTANVPGTCSSDRRDSLVLLSQPRDAISQDARAACKHTGYRVCIIRGTVARASVVR